MFKLRMLLPLLLLFCGAYIACNKDDINNYGPKVSVAFAGRVLDENGTAISNAEVSVGGESTSTDVNGVFRLKAVRQDARNAILQVRKVGYFEFSRAYSVQDESTHSVKIHLLKKVPIGYVNASSGGAIDVPGGAKLTFSANSISDKTGNAYTGSVYIFARYLDPASSNLSSTMPGDLRGINTGGDEGILSTFGMLGVVIEDFAGQQLQVAYGSEVEIRMPISASQAAVAPSVIPLWHFNNETARWEEEGTAQKIGNEYVGMVKHFSFWNCDAFSETVYMEGKVFWRSNQRPLANVEIRLTVLLNGFKGYAITQGNGWFGGAIPKDYELKLEVLVPDMCGGQVLYTQNIGPFANDVVLPDIIIDNLNTDIINIRGRLVDCTGQAVENGYAVLSIQNAEFVAYPGTDGKFEIQLLNCLGSANGTVTGYDFAELLSSNETTFLLDANGNDLGDIQVCSTLEEYIQYTLNGQSFTFIDPSGAVDNSTVYMSAGQDSLAGSGFFGMTFSSNEQPGTFPILTLHVNGLGIDAAQPATLNTTVTTFGANAGDPIIGTFGTSFIEANGSSHTLSGSYRVKRDW